MKTPLSWCAFPSGLEIRGVAPLSPQEKQQLWRQYQAQKQKKLDPHLKRDLKHGWLFPYLTQTENLMWGRWQYWQEWMLLTQSNYSLCAIGIDINRDLLECALVQFALYASWYYCTIWRLGNTDLICSNSLTLENFESINTKFWLPIFADIVKVELKPIDKQAYRESLRQTLQNSQPQNNVNLIVSNALNDKGSIPKIHQTSLFDYLK